jgi:hypothetical protein
MAHVFISYERSSERTAREVTRLVERHGHSWWSDSLIPPHRDYGDAIFCSEPTLPYDCRVEAAAAKP